MCYCIYLRKSRKDEELGEETLQRHKNMLLNLAKTKNINIIKIYEEIKSGDTISERPQMQKLLKDVANGDYKGVLVVEIERLARGNTIDQGIVAKTFKDSKTKIITPIKTYDPNDEFDEEYFEFSLFMSRREYKTINRRIQRGRIASVKEGKFIASTAPLGYDKVKLKDKNGYTLKPNQYATIIKLIFKLYTEENQGIGSIAKYLDSIFIKPKNSEKWSKSSLKDILTNPVYIGKIRWGYKKNTDYILVDGLHNPIIDEKTFYKANQMLKNKTVSHTIYDKQLKNPLSSLIFCKKCGKALTRINSNTKDKYYSLKCPNPYCNNVSAPIYLIENSILNFLNEILIPIPLKFNFKNINNENITDFNYEIKHIDNEINKLNNQLNELYNLLEQKVYTPNIFINRNKNINNQINKLYKIKNHLLKQQGNKNIKNFPPISKDIFSIYNELNNIEDKNNLLKELIYKIEYNRDTKTTKNKRDEAQFELTIYPKINNIYDK